MATLAQAVDPVYTAMRPDELADLEFIERVAIITDGCHVSPVEALWLARRQRAPITSKKDS